MVNYKKTYDKKGNVKLRELSPEEAVAYIDRKKAEDEGVESAPAPPVAADRDGNCQGTSRKTPCGFRSTIFVYLRDCIPLLNVHVKHRIDSGGCYSYNLSCDPTVVYFEDRS